MYFTQTDHMYQASAEGRDGTRVPLHNIPSEYPHELEEASSSGNDVNNDGTWGERDVGGPVDFRAAMQDYEDMRRELIQNLDREI
jgi:ATP-binding cassette subfamily G (WHITE) protein 2 (SNQ2)